MSSLSTLPKGDSAWLLRKSIQRIMQQVSVLETNIGSSTTGNSADTQVIFNDAGTLRGDTGLTYDKSADRLSFGAGICYGLLTSASATITGDLTVRTTGLVVGSTATGIGTTPNTWSGAWKAAQVGRLTLGNATTDSLIGHNFYNDGSYRFAANDFASYYDQVGGAHIWGSSVTSGTAGNAIGWTVLATLNATGLGVGVTPGSAIGNLQVGGSSNVNLYVQQGTDTIRMGVRASGRTGIILDSSNATYTNRAWYLDNVGSSGSLIIGRQGLDVITFDNSGNCGIGVTPSAWSANYRVIEIGRSGNAFWGQSGVSGVFMSSNALLNSGGSFVYSNTAASTYYTQNTGRHEWYNAPSGTAGNAITFTQAMTLDASGNLLVGVTSTTTPGVGNTTAGGSLNANGAAFFSHASSQALYLNTNVDGQIVSIRRSNVAVGSISVTTTGTTFNSLSDYRLKEAVAPLSGGLARISALKPSVYKWKADGSNGEGFLAHELAEVVPLAVTGEKDAVNEDGSIKAQGVDLSKVVPVLVAAIQELAAEVNALKNA